MMSLIADPAPLSRGAGEVSLTPTQPRPSDALLAALGLPPEARDAFEEALINAMPDDLLVKLTWQDPADQDNPQSE